jgi:hypothetical protein
VNQKVFQDVVGRVDVTDGWRVAGTSRRRLVCGALVVSSLALLSASAAFSEDKKVFDFKGEFGSLGGISLPAKWVESHEHAAPPRRVVKFSTDANSDSGVYVSDPVSDGAPDNAVRDIFAASVAGQPVALTKEQIVALSRELQHVGNVGYNQYMVPNPGPDDPKEPFRLDTASLVSINGKTAVRIDGAFVEDSGGVIGLFTGVFTPSDIGGWRLLSIYVQSREKAEFNALKAAMDDALKTLQWRK